MKLIINVHIDNKNNNLVNILFDDKIRKISEKDINISNCEIIDLKGKLLIPGCIDAHVHFNDPVYSHHEDFISGTTAAAFGGITTIIDMPCTSIPPVTNVKNFRHKLEIVQPKALVDFAFWGGIRQNDFPLNEKQITDLWNAGIVGFKIYTISGMDSFEALSYTQIAKTLKAFPEILFGFHAEDETIIKQNSVFRKTAENYAKIRSIEAEFTAVKNILNFSENAKIHFVHISSKKAAELILQSENATFETCPHYLQFTADDLPKLRGKLKTAPPVKFAEDRDFLRQCVHDEKVDFITTDHAGCDFKTEKDFADFAKIYNGIPATELMIPFLFSEFYQKEKTNLAAMIKLTSENAAKRFGIYPQKGSLQIGTDADFTVINLQKASIVDETKLHSKGKYSPFDETKFSCSIDRTIVRGKTIFDAEKGILQKAGCGKFIKRN